MKEYEITIGTFQHILEGYKVADEMAKAGAMASAFSLTEGCEVFPGVVNDLGLWP